jgi:isochorismate synthase EntC
VSVASEPSLQRLRHAVHLKTEVTGVALPGVHVLDLVSRLHPTPAVAGTPSEAALGLIRALEPRSRGWYAGPIGWVDASGDGDFAVGIRSAFVRGRRALVYAGAGIVEGSVAELEWEECATKMRFVEDALGTWPT